MLGSQASASDHLGDLHRAGGFSSGYGNSADAQFRQQQGGESAALGQGLTGTLSDLQGQEQDAAFSRDSALYEAQQAAAQQAIQNGAFDPANVSGNGDDYGAGVSEGSPLTATASAAQRNAVLLRLLGKHVTPAVWAKNHPGLAKEYGISSVKGANAKLIKAAMAARKKGGR